MAKTTTEQGNRNGDTGVDDRLGLILNLLVVQGEQTRSILQVLTAEKPSDGPSLAAQVGELIARLDDQNRHLKELTLAVGRLARDLPSDLVAAIGDGLDGLTRTGAVHHANGHDRT